MTAAQFSCCTALVSYLFSIQKKEGVIYSLVEHPRTQNQNLKVLKAYQQENKLSSSLIIQYDLIFSIVVASLILPVYVRAFSWPPIYGKRQGGMHARTSI